MEVFTGSISQKPTDSDVMEGDAAGAEMSTACDVKVGSSFQNENSTAPPSPKRMRLDMDRVELPPADMPFHTNNCEPPLTDAEKERLLAQSGGSSLPYYISQQSDTTKKQAGEESEKVAVVEFEEESLVHNQEFAPIVLQESCHPLSPISAEETEIDVKGEIGGSQDLLQGDDEHVVKSHLVPITCDNMDAVAFEKCPVSTYSSGGHSSVAVESSDSATDDFQKEFYDNACREQGTGTEKYHTLTASHSVSDSSPSDTRGNPYGTLSGHREVEGSPDRRGCLFSENAHACDGETKAKVNEERVVCDEEMADYASPGSIFTYDVSLSGDLGSNEPKINVSLAHSVPVDAALWLSAGATEGAEGLRKCDEYTTVAAQAGLSQIPVCVYNDIAAVTEMDAGHEVNGAGQEGHVSSEHLQPEVSSLTSDSTSVTTLPCASDMTLNGITAFEEDTTQTHSPFPEFCVEASTVRNVVCELSGASQESHITAKHLQPEVNSQTSESKSVTTLPCASDMTLNGITAFEEDTTQTHPFPEAYAEAPTVRSLVCELSGDHCAFLSPLNSDTDNFNMAHIPGSLSEEDEQLLINCIGLDALFPTPSGFAGEGPTEDTARIHPQGLPAFESFTKPAESFDMGTEADTDSCTAGAKTDSLVLASLVSNSMDHHESQSEAAVACSSPTGLLDMEMEVGCFFKSSPSPNEMRLGPQSENWKEEKSEKHSDEVAEQQPVIQSREENVKVTDAFAHGDTSHEFAVKDMPAFTLCSDAVVPGSHTTPTEDVTKESTARHVFSDCVPLGFDSFEKVKISPDSDLENSPLLDSSPTVLAAAAVSHVLTVPPPDYGPVTLAHCGIHSDEAIELISHCKDNCPVFSQDRGTRWGGSQKSITAVSPQQSLSPFEPEENIFPSDRITDCDIPLFEMKEMFDLVVEELCLYFEIDREEEEEESSESRKEERSASHFRPFSKSEDVIVSSDSILEAEQEEEESSDVHKELDCEQEVPLESDHPHPDGEDSMYSTMRNKELRKSDTYMSWSPAFLSVPFLEHLREGRVETPPKRLEPLKTCSRPIRVGLSKKARTKQLHPNPK
ncbi:uncharacterized protein LOC134098043 [Sardina pilchardus]|uniref:uncharacterized protein LOC134098043 n=1 Tax=Sardina pilchardus TaxID=27697 RepID=UPI002E0E4976